MKVQVVRVWNTDKDFRVALCRHGHMYGSVLASLDVDQPGEYELKTTLQEQDGRLVALLKVEKEK